MQKVNDTTTYRIMWGHSGTRGAEWATAREASQYAAEEWGRVDASTPDRAVEIAKFEGVDVGDWWHDGEGAIHIIPPVGADRPDLRAWRTRMGWSQERLAEALGVHPMTVSKWERGASEPQPYLPLALQTLEQGA